MGYSTIFRRFIERVLLKEVNQKIIIFIDELDWLIDTGFIEEFLMLLRGLYESQKYKSRNNTYSYNFVLSGIYFSSNYHGFQRFGWETMIFTSWMTVSVVLAMHSEVLD